MVRRYWPTAQLTAVVLAIGVVAPQVAAQQQQRAPWQAETNSPPAPLVVPSPGRPSPVRPGAAQHDGRAALRATRGEACTGRDCRRAGIPRGRSHPGRPEHRSGPHVAGISRQAGARREAAARFHAPRGKPDAAPRSRRLRRQRCVRPRAPDPQDRGLEREPAAGAFRSQCRGASADTRAGKRRGRYRQGGQLRDLLRRARPVRPEDQGDERGEARARQQAERRHLQRRRHLRRCKCRGPGRCDRRGRQAYRGDDRPCRREGDLQAVAPSGRVRHRRHAMERVQYPG